MNTLSSVIFAQLLLTGADTFWGTRMLYRGCNNAPRSLQLLANVDGRHSFVEGEDFADRSAELEALGGDPFFLDDDDDESVSEEDGVEEMVSRKWQCLRRYWQCLRRYWQAWLRVAVTWM
jgi:hypothetical protein